jgi:hypothetical protein
MQSSTGGIQQGSSRVYERYASEWLLLEKMGLASEQRLVC